MTTLTGAAVVDITPPVGVFLDGYGARLALCQPHCEGMIREAALELLDEVRQRIGNG